MKRKVLLSTLFLMLHMTVVLAQQVTISGQVLDEKSEPLIGATVNIEGTTNAVITDLEGKFTLKALPSEKIVISYLGYKPKTVAIGKNRKFNITLDPSVTEMDEIVVVGYGSQRKSDIATAVASVNIKDIAKSSSAQTLQALQGKISGVQIIPTDGSLSSGMTFRIRGVNSITGGTQPLFVIDRLNIVNNADEDSTNPMGISLFANAIDIIKKIDLEYDSYANEFSLGRKRIFVAPEYLTFENGNAVFDPDDTVFYELPEDYFKNSESKEAMHEVNMELRIEEHSKALNDDLNWMSLKCGFGTDRYKFENGGVKTATEVISENSDMYRSLTKHELVLERVLIQLIRTIIRAGNTIGIPGLDENTDITIAFDDSIIEDKTTERQSDRQDVSMGVMGLAEYRSKWYGETPEQAQKNLPEQANVMPE